MLSTLIQYWWILPILVLLVGYKFVLRVFFGMVIVPEDKIGLVTKKIAFGNNKELPDGRIIATKGEAGFQARPLPPGGPYWGYWPWQYSVEMQSFIVIPAGKIGLVEAKDGAPLPVGNILARRVDCDNFQDTIAFLNNGGQKGKQTTYLPSGTYRINTLAFTVSVTEPVIIYEGKLGIVTTMDGAPLLKDHIAGQVVEGHNNFQDFDTFLSNGGQRGPQPGVIQAGTYYLNPWAVSVDQINMTEVPIGHVGVMISYIGEEGQDVSGDEFKHGNLVKKGERGVCSEVLSPGKYAINTFTHKIELIPTTNIVLNWANGTSEAHNLDSNLSTITVRSSDGFPFNLDVSQIIHVPATEAPKVIARCGSMKNLVSQVLEPTIQNYFRNSAQTSGVIDFLKERQKRQNEAKEQISKVLTEYNVNAVDTLIGDINPPKELMKTLTDRKIAEEEKTTYNTQMEAQKVRQTLEKETAIADKQKEIVDATQSVEIANRKADAEVKTAEGKATSAKVTALANAEVIKTTASANAEAQVKTAEANAKAVKLSADAEAERTSKVGKAEAEKIEAIGDATAKAYKQQVEAMGADNFGRLKVVEQIANGKVKIIPELLIQGGAGSESPVSGLLAMQLLDTLKAKESAPVTSVTTAPTPQAN